MGVAGINQGEWGCRILDIGWGVTELVDLKGAVGMNRGSGGWQILREVKGYWILGGGCWN